MALTPSLMPVVAGPALMIRAAGSTARTPAAPRRVSSTRSAAFSGVPFHARCKFGSFHSS